MKHPDRFLLAGVMGWPVLHSRSPMIHNHWLESEGLSGRYIPLPTPPERLGAALRALPALGFAGCNLTIPHKEQALAHLDEVEPTAGRIGAVSCVTVRADGALIGSNNDAYGFIESILEQQPDWRADRGPAVVIGAGGAARAVAWSLSVRGAKEIRLINRSLERAVALAHEFGAPVAAVPWEQRGAALAGAALLVNATSLGMSGQPQLDLALSELPPSALVTDVVYTPLVTGLLAAARARGNPTVDGLGMLLHQARPAWRGWFGIDPRVTARLRRMIEATLPR